MKYKKRKLEASISELFDIFPIVTITGPRQSGKTTLIKHYIEQAAPAAYDVTERSSHENKNSANNKYSSWKYHSLDNRELLLRIKSDPTLFVKSFNSNIVIDEAQKCPELFHAVKEIVDNDFPYKILLSGSANFLLLKSITETLSGRVGILELLPFSLTERFNLESNNFIETVTGAKNIEELFALLSELNTKRIKEADILDFIFHGGYPKIYDLQSEKAKLTWFQNYINTYLERDLRDLAQVSDLDTFQRVYKLIAHQNAGILNMTTTASDVGAAVQTIKKYISILETSYHLRMLPSYHFNQRKQIIKTPKVFFLDTGLINYIIRNHSIERMLNSSTWGATLEAHIYAELLKEAKDMVPRPSIYYWRTNNGAEVDFVIEKDNTLIPIEVKSAVHIRSSSIRGLKSFQEAQEKNKVPFSIVLYRGEEIVYINKSTLAVPIGILY
jgi:predicted AAA+ superfamily ATPase